MSGNFSKTQKAPSEQKYSYYKILNGRIGFSFLGHWIQPRTEEDLEALLALSRTKNGSANFFYGALNLTRSDYCVNYINGTCPTSAEDKKECYFHNMPCNQYESTLPLKCQNFPSSL